MPFTPPDRTLPELRAATRAQLIQPTGGVYILQRTDGQRFGYPLGDSAVFYIGRTGANKRRLYNHQTHIKNAYDDHAANGRFTKYWWPRYAYGAVFGAKILWFNERPNYDPKALESLFVDYFYWVMGALPVANGAWPAAKFQYPPVP